MKSLYGYKILKNRGKASEDYYIGTEENTLSCKAYQSRVIYWKSTENLGLPIVTHQRKKTKLIGIINNIRQNC